MGSYKMIANSGNYRRGRSDSIKYIVIHYTSNKGDTALNNATYFRNNVTKTSAHYFVDENNIYQSVELYDTAWHCGGGLQSNGGHAFYKKCTNSNSIGIEMCLNSRSGSIRYAVIDKAIELTRQLMAAYGIDANHVIRHWDVVGKYCPGPMIGNNNALWNNFKSRISEEEIDMEELNRLKEQINNLSAQLNQNAAAFNSSLNKQGERINNAENEIKNLWASKEKSYDHIWDVPEWGREAVQKLINFGAFTEDFIAIPHNLVRMAVMLDRIGILELPDEKYAKLEDVPEWGKDIVSKLIKEGKLRGASEDNLDLSYTMLRILVILDRAKVFDSKATFSQNTLLRSK